MVKVISESDITDMEDYLSYKESKSAQNNENSIMFQRVTKVTFSKQKIGQKLQENNCKMIKK